MLAIVLMNSAFLHFEKEMPCILLHQLEHGFSNILFIYLVLKPYSGTTVGNFWKCLYYKTSTKAISGTI